MDGIVEIDGVTKLFDQLVAVDRVSLRVQQGQTLGLIGPNGAGKTTLLRMICTLAKPDAGDVRIGGLSVRRQAREVRRAIGFMPAEFGCPRSLTIREYLDYFACMHGVSPQHRQQRIREVCELMDLLGREDVMVKGLSTGNRQRLLLAKTLLHDPSVLILDEPASGLDPRARTELRGILRALASMGKTIIISSHILPDLEDISDRIGIMEAGRLVVEGDLLTLRNQLSSAKRILRLRVPESDEERALTIIRGVSNVLACELRDHELVVESEASDGNGLLAELLQQNVRILRFVDDEPNLEEIFMQSTAGKVT